MIPHHRIYPPVMMMHKSSASRLTMKSISLRWASLPVSQRNSLLPPMMSSITPRADSHASNVKSLPGSSHSICACTKLMAAANSNPG